jgi:enamine deaminase RidA (YjgF/YER057c/UK114 family)
MMRIGSGQLTTVAFGVLAGLLLASPPPQKEEEEPKTQVLALPPDPPAVSRAEAARLVFHVSPLSTDGLLSKQTDNALKALARSNRRNRIVHLRAFVAGSGDTRRVQTVVSEFFSRRRQALPSLTVVQVGHLPAQGAQVVVESVAESREAVNPHGLAFLAGQTVATGEAVLEIAYLSRDSLQKISAAAADLGSDAAHDVVRVTCYCSSLDDGAAVRRSMAAAFPRAALNHLQLRRVYTPAAVTCEAVVRLKTPPPAPLALANPGPLSPAADCSQAALVAPGEVIFTTAQLAFRYQDSDVKLAFGRLGESLKEAGVSFGDVAIVHFYAVPTGIGERIRELKFDYFDRNRPPANTLLEVEGLPSLDTSFAMDVVAVAR